MSNFYQGFEYVIPVRYKPKRLRKMSKKELRAEVKRLRRELKVVRGDQQRLRRKYEPTWVDRFRNTETPLLNSGVGPMDKQRRLSVKQTLTFSADNYNQTTAAINCFGGTVGLTVAVSSDGEDDHVTVYPEVTINYLDWFPLCIATISDDGDLIAYGVQVDDRGAAFSFNTRPFRQIRVRVSGVPDGEELTAKIELVVRS